MAEFKIATKWHPETGDTYIDLTLAGGTFTMPVYSAKEFAQHLMDACDQGILDEHMFKFMRHEKFTDDQIKASIGAFRQMRRELDPRTPAPTIQEVQKQFEQQHGSPILQIVKPSVVSKLTE